MIDGHLAPVDLEAARRRVRSVVDGRGLGSTVVLSGARFDDGRRNLITPATTVVAADFVLWRWTDADLIDLVRRLPSAAVLVFLEPTADFGWRRLVHRIFRLPIRLALGHHFEADVPARLRAAGLDVTTTDRFDLGPADLRSYVWGRAERISSG